MPLIWVAILGLVAAVGWGCSEEPRNSTPETHFSGSALPIPPDPGQDSHCAPDIDPDDLGGFEPELSAWVLAAERVIVATVDRVEVPDSAALVRANEHIGAISPEDCNDYEPGSILHLRDVETLAGIAIPGSIELRMSWNDSSNAGAVMDTSRGVLVDADENPVYYPGSRVGFGLHTRSGVPGYVWNSLQQFEVVEGVVALSHLHRESLTYCNVRYTTAIPDDFQGSDFEDFRQAIAVAASAQVSDLGQRQAASVQGGMSLERPDWHFGSICRDDVSSEDVPEENNRPSAQ